MSEHVNLNPNEFSEGGGLIDDFDGIISDIRFIMTDYGGGIQDAIPAAKVVFNIDGEETEPALFSVGGKGDFAPDETGMGLIKLKEKSTLTKTAKFSMLLASLVEAGFPVNKMDGENISYLNGLEGHFLRKAVTYSGIKVKEGKDSTVLLCTKVIKLPWDQKAKGKGKSTGKVAVASEEIAETVAGLIQGIIIENEGEIAKKNAVSALFKEAAIKKMNAADKKVALKLAGDDTFLSGREEWSYENGVLKM